MTFAGRPCGTSSGAGCRAPPRWRWWDTRRGPVHPAVRHRRLGHATRRGRQAGCVGVPCWAKYWARWPGHPERGGSWVRSCETTRESGGTGRRAGLRIQRGTRGGSTPPSRTTDPGDARQPKVAMKVDVEEIGRAASGASQVEEPPRGGAAGVGARLQPRAAAGAPARVPQGQGAAQHDQAPLRRRRPPGGGRAPDPRGVPAGARRDPAGARRGARSPGRHPRGKRAAHVLGGGGDQARHHARRVHRRSTVSTRPRPSPTTSVEEALGAASASSTPSSAPWSAPPTSATW